jgi:hypothetical protein
LPGASKTCLTWSTPDGAGLGITSWGSGRSCRCQRGEGCDGEGAVAVHVDVGGEPGEDLLGAEAEAGRDGAQGPARVRRQPKLRAVRPLRSRVPASTRRVGPTAPCAGASFSRVHSPSWTSCSGSYVAQPRVHQGGDSGAVAFPRRKQPFGTQLGQSAPGLLDPHPRRDHQVPGARVGGVSGAVPPAADGGDGERGGVVVGAHVGPAHVRGQVVDAVRDRLAEFPVGAICTR